MSSIKEIDKATVFLPEEERLLSKSISLREQIIDKYVEENGIPTKARDIRVINEVLNSLDSVVLGKVDRRLKHEENQQNEDMIEFAKSILLSVEEKKNTVTITEKEKMIELTEGLRPDEVVLGEDQIEYEELSLDEIIKG